MAMQIYFVEQAETYEDACLNARKRHGERVEICSKKSVQLRKGLFGFLFPKEGVEVTGFIPPLPNPQGVGVYNAPRPMRQNEAAAPSDFETQKRKVIEAAKGDMTMLQVLNEVRNIKEKLENQNQTAVSEVHPCIQRLDDLLITNDFSPAYREMILSRAKKNFSLDELDDFDAVQDKVLEWIGESISIMREDTYFILPKVIVIVGATGVGKTTTIAKLAANFGIDHTGQKIRQVVLVTIDSFRIGATHQMEAYGSILEFPCFIAKDFNELKSAIAINSDGTDIILVDTIGKNPRDMVKLGEMKQLLDACGSQAEVHLAVSSATKYSDLLEIMRQFEPFNYRYVIATKLDETLRTGNIISALAEKGKQFSYITNGQKVPVDLHKASVMQFLLNLEGFKVNRIALEEKFAVDESGNLQIWR